MNQSNTWDIRYTDTSGELRWLGRLTDEAAARALAQGMDEHTYRSPHVVDRLQELRTQFPVGATVVWNGGVRRPVMAVVQDHRLDEDFIQQQEVLEVVQHDDGRTVEIFASYAVLIRPPVANSRQAEAILQRAYALAEQARVKREDRMRPHHLVPIQAEAIEAFEQLLAHLAGGGAPPSRWDNLTG